MRRSRNQRTKYEISNPKRCARRPEMLRRQKLRVRRCEGLLADLLAVLRGFGGDGDSAFFAELEPGLERLLLLGNDGHDHVTVP
jgi:hypothetical protein